MTTVSSLWSQLLLLSCCVVVLLLAFPSPVQSATKNAYVCIHYEGTPKDDEYVLGTRVLLKSLKMSGTKQDIIVLVAPNVRHETREQFRQDGAIVQEVKNIPNPWKVRQVADHEGGGTYRSRFEFTLNKIHLWNLTQYERVVYLDADNIVLSNLDELFYCAHFCAVFMNPCNFHTGLLVVRPDTKMFNKILTTLEKENPRSYDGADQGFFTYFFNFERIGGARMFDPYDGKTEPAEDEMMRLPPGYNLNALWFYEKGDWHLYRCHSRFMNLTVPGVSLTFPTPPWLKPWYWWPYLLLDSNWFLWQSFRAQLGESFTSVVIGTLAVLLAFVVLTAWGLPFASSSPRVLSILDKYFNRPLNFAVSLMGDNLTGILMGLLCALLVNLLPWYFLPGILPPDIGWFLYAVSEQSLNFIFLTVLSFIIVKRNRALGVDVLMKQSVRSMIPSVLLMIALFVVCRFKLYPAGLPFHTGKILSVFSIALVFLLCQIASYRKLVVEKNPQALILSNHH